MGSPQKFLLPSPNFNKKGQTPPTVKPHFLTPSGMTLHARHQPPPMYGKRGATYPGKFLQNSHKNNNNSATFAKPPAAETVEINESQFCEACDMELQSLDDLRRHRAQHEKCPVDSCSYRGHPSVMDKHVTALHNSGLFEKFKKLSTPEEIAAWREERKRKYPTVENTLMRQKAKEQREKRGERLEGNKSRFGKYEDRKRAQDNTKRPPRPQNERPNQNAGQHKNNMQNKRPNNKRRRREEQQKLEEKKQNEKIAQIKIVNQECDSEVVAEHKEEVERSCDGVYMFKGTSALKGYQHLKSKKVKETNVLSSLLGMYGSDEDTEEDESESERKGDEENGDAAALDCLERENNNIKSTLNEAKNSDDSINKQTVEVQPQVEQLIEVAAKQPEAASESVHETPSKDESGQAMNSEAKSTKNEEALENTNPETATEDISKHKSGNNSEENKEHAASDDDAPEEVPIARSSDIPMPTKRTQPLKENEPSTSGSTPATKRSKTDQLAKRRQQKYGLDYRKTRLRKQNTLLEKLLEPDIRHERNVLLQCVRYVCENKFFGIGEEKKD